MSNGNQFKNAKEDDDIKGSFMEWCRMQDSHLETFFKEVLELVLLFNNRGSEEEKSEQRRELVAMIDKLIPGGRRYTDDKFQKARKELERLRLGNKIFEIDEDVQDETNLIVYEKKIVSNRIQISKNNCSL